MRRHFFLAVLALGIGLGMASVAEAQVFVRAPFVRVQVGGGVYVRAPFVNLWFPPPPAYVGPPPNAYVPAMPRIVESPAPQPSEPQPQQQQQQQQQPPATPDNSPPQPSKGGPQAPTLEQFAQNFQPKAGNYDVTIINPVTNQPTQVRFSLPEGNPRRVHVRRNEIEFDYAIRHFVRIEFDRDGAMITSR
jgi:hypothetical protein